MQNIYNKIFNMEEIMFKVEIDFGSAVTLLGYIPESIYDELYPQLEKFAKRERGTLIEHEIQIQEINE